MSSDLDYLRGAPRDAAIPVSNYRSRLGQIANDPNIAALRDDLARAKRKEQTGVAHASACDELEGVANASTIARQRIQRRRAAPAAPRPRTRTPHSCRRSASSAPGSAPSASLRASRTTSGS